MKQPISLTPFFLVLSLFFLNFSLSAQCPFPNSGFGSGIAPSTPGSSVILETCNFTDEYVTAYNVQMGDSYLVSYSGGNGDFVVAYDNTFTAIAWGDSSLIFIAPYSGTYYSSSFINPNCGMDFSCNASLWTNMLPGTYEYASACGQYTWPFNNQTYTSSGTYSDTVTTPNGLDTVYLGLTLNNLDLAVTSTQSVLNAQQASATYQWIDCSTNLPISNETNQSFSPTQGGIYAVIVSDGVCSDTSLCTSINLNFYDTIASCGQYTWPLNNQLYNATGMYADSVMTTAGYDVTYLNLTVAITPSDLLVLESSNALTSQFPSQPLGSYQWIDCSTNLPISGETNQSFLPIIGGSYAVIISDGVCLDTSLCFPISLTTTETVTGCGQYTWPLNNQTYNTTGLYLDSVMTSVGYDLVYLNLTIPITPMDLVVVDSNNVLYSLFPIQITTSYQWIDCSTNLPVTGATSQWFAPMQGGSYAVIISEGNCSDTTDCTTVAFANIESLVESNFSIFPNPTNDFVKISFEGAGAQLEIIDSKGKILYSNQVDNGDRIDMTHFDSGLYLFNFQSSEKNETLRVIRE